MAHSWFPPFYASLVLLCLCHNLFHFVSAVLFSLLCSPFSSHFLFQKLLSKSLLSFSTYQSSLHFPFSTSVYLHMSPGVFMKHSHVSFRKAVGRASLREEEWRYVRLGARGVSALLGHQLSHLSYTTRHHSALFLHVNCSTCSILPFIAMCLWDKFPADAPHGWSRGSPLNSCPSLSAPVVVVKAHQVPFLSQQGHEVSDWCATRE